MRIFQILSFVPFKNNKQVKKIKEKKIKSVTLPYQSSPITFWYLIVRILVCSCVAFWKRPFSRIVGIKRKPDPAHNLSFFFFLWGWCDYLMCKRGADRKKPLLVKLKWPQRWRYVSNWLLLLIGVCVARGQKQRTEKKNKRPKFFFFFTLESEEIFCFWLLCSRQSDFFWSVTLLLLHVPSGVTPKSPST